MLKTLFNFLLLIQFTSSCKNTLVPKNTLIENNPLPLKEEWLNSPPPLRQSGRPETPIETSLVLKSISTALIPVIEVNPGDWFLNSQKNGSYPDAKVVSAFAPLPVFFEGWKSSSTNSSTPIVDYIWDFGDNSPRTRGMNTAHVYEIPGVYTASLYILDGLGNYKTSTLVITVLKRTQKKYYVDSQIGNDNYSGLCSEINVTSNPICGPWKSAYKAFNQMALGRTPSGSFVPFYKNGDEILFNRGQIFPMETGVTISHWSSGYGYRFGTYGTGANPIIQYTGSESTTLIFQQGNGAAFISFQDLDIRLKGPTGARSNFYRNAGQAQNLLFLRIAVSHFSNSAMMIQGELSGIFVIKSQLYDSSSIQFYTDGKTERLGLMDNDFDLSANHINYIDAANNAVITGNRFSRSAFGRHALRMCGNIDHAYVARNLIQGWIDPVVCTDKGCTCPVDYQGSCEEGGSHTAARGDGKRYNWLLVHFAPNTPELQSINNVTFESNILSNAETLINVGSANNILIRNNLMVTADSSTSSKIHLGSIHGFDKKPSKNIKILGNTLISQGASAGGSLLQIHSYTGPSYNGLNQHEGIEVSNNIFERLKGSIIFDVSSALFYTLTFNLNLFHEKSSNNPLFKVDSNTTTLSSWINQSGQDTLSKTGDPLFVNQKGSDGTLSNTEFDSNLALSLGSPGLENGGILRSDLIFDFFYHHRSTRKDLDIGAIQED